MGSKMSRYKLGDITTVSFTNRWERSPRDPVTMWVANTVATALGVAAGTAAFTAITVLSFVAVTAVTTAIVSALIPKPDFGGGGSSGLLVNSRDAMSPAQFVYGEIRKGGPVTFVKASGSNNKVLHQIIVLAAHEVEEIGDIYINDEVVTMSNEDVTSAPWNGHIKIYKHLGNQTSKTTPFANSSSKHLENTLHNEAEVEDTFIGKGLAYLYCRLSYDQDAFVNGVPLITAVVKGKKVVKTINGVEQSPTYTNNSAWVIRDLLTSEYGLDDNSIDHYTFEAAAAVCDDSSRLSSNEGQYQVNGVVDANASVGSVLDNFITTCGGTLFWGAGKWRLYAGAYITPTRAALTLDDVRGPISIDTRVPMRDNFNVVGGTFINKGVYHETNNPDGGDWISQDYPEVRANNAFVAVDNQVEKKLDLNLPYTTDGEIAQLIAKQMLSRSREQITFSATFSLDCMDIEVGDFVTVTIPRYSWNNKVFEVIGWNLDPNATDGALGINLTLRETSINAFSFTAADYQAIELNNADFVKFYDVPALGVTVDQDFRVINQNVTNILTVDVTSTDPDRIDYVIVKYKKTNEADSAYKTVGQGKLVGQAGSGVAFFEINDIDTPQIGEQPINYTVHVTPVNSFGFRGTPTETYFNVSADTIPPNAPTNLTKVLSGGTAFFNWEGSTSLDLSHYKLYYNSNTSANFGDVGNEVKIAKIARPATSISYPVGVGKYFISAVDKTGNESQLNVPSVLVASSELPALDADQQFDEHTAFSGSKTNLTVSGGELFMTSYANSGSSGTYDFDHNGLSYFDLGSSRTVRLSYTSTHTRKHANAVNGEVNWDDIPDNWDSWPNFWDTWTDEEAAFQDHNVIVEGRAGSTIAAMGSASFTTVPCELVGRYVEFRARLTNSGPNVSPSVTALTAKVEY